MGLWFCDDGGYGVLQSVTGKLGTQGPWWCSSVLVRRSGTGSANGQGQETMNVSTLKREGAHPSFSPSLFHGPDGACPRWRGRISSPSLLNQMLSLFQKHPGGHTQK